MTTNNSEAHICSMCVCVRCCQGSDPDAPDYLHQTTPEKMPLQAEPAHAGPSSEACPSPPSTLALKLAEAQLLVERAEAQKHSACGVAVPLQQRDDELSRGPRVADPELHHTLNELALEPRDYNKLPLVCASISPDDFAARNGRQDHEQHAVLEDWLALGLVVNHCDREPALVVPEDRFGP